MTSRHRTTTLLGPEDTVLIRGRRTDGHRPRIVAALHELPADGPVLAEAVAAARRLDGELVLLHAEPLSFAERSVGLDEAVRRGERMLVDATARATTAGRAPKEALLLRMRPHELVGERLDADLLVIGGPRSGEPATGVPRCDESVQLGLVVGSAARYAPCTLLVVPRG
jgi:nucleotide-binding universal stress UspA family protein